MGNLHRMDLDGSNHVVLSYNLVAPGTLALSHERKTLIIFSLMEVDLIFILQEILCSLRLALA